MSDNSVEECLYMSALLIDSHWFDSSSDYNIFLMIKTENIAVICLNSFLLNIMESVDIFLMIKTENIALICLNSFFVKYYGIGCYELCI